MKPLLRVSRELAVGHTMLYLYYEQDKAVARTIDVTESGSVAVDLASDDETVGVELIDPGPDELEALTRIARERGLSLKGLFSFSS